MDNDDAARRGPGLNGLPYYKRYPRDFFEGTIGMPFDLKAAYGLVLDLIYMQGGALPDDPRYISGHLGCSVRAWNMWRKTLLEMGKIYVAGNVIRNFRADNLEISSRTLQEKQREKRLGWRKNKDLTTTTVKPQINHTDTDTDIKKEESSTPPKKDTLAEGSRGGEKPSKGKLESGPRGSRLSSDWCPSAADLQMAQQEGFDDDAIRRMADEFRDYWISVAGEKGRKLDWPATWRNWVRRRRDRGVQSAGSRSPGRSSPHDTLLAAGAMLAGRYRDAERGEKDDRVPEPPGQA